MAKTKAKKSPKPTDPSGNLNAGTTVRRIERRRYEEKLPCPIDDASRHKKSDELAKAVADRAAWLERRKKENSVAREERAYFDKLIEELGQDVHQHQEFRMVELVEYLIPESKTIEVVRTDTGVIVRHRAASTVDLQENLLDGKALDGPKPKPRGSKASKSESMPEPPFGEPPKEKPAVGDDDPELPE